MKKITKILIPLVASILNIHSAQNFYNFNNHKFERQKELNKLKKEYYEQAIKSIFPHMDSIKYAKDIDIHRVKDLWQTPQETDSLKTGDCEDKSFLAYSLLKNKGLDVKLAWGKLHDSSIVNHFWINYKIGNEGYIVETTSKKGAKIIKKDTFNLKKNYIKYILNYHKLNLIEDFEHFSGLELEINNPYIR